MRKYKEKIYIQEMQNFIKIMEQVKIALQQELQVDYKNVFSSLQEKLISIGTDIEENNSNVKHLVTPLEHICELLYQFVNMEDVIFRMDVIAQIINYADKLIMLIRNEKKEDKLVMFIPYKASMWDSLESIWKATVEDKECKSYVVPIPYYEKSVDGTCGELRYEGSEFPDYVPIEDWESLDIDKIHPDIIFFHNPYDGVNKVTSVIEKYYSKELRKNTELLVYVPYFVATNDKVQEHLCTLPGVIYSDVTIVQSEKVRETYIAELSKLEKDNNCVGVFGDLKNKIIALGSPKYDKVKGINKEEYLIPQEWADKIIDINGNRKKVILYNNTISSLLKFRKKMMGKIRETFDLLNGENEIVLWRPHPLLKKTIEVQCPELLDDYNKIIEEYLKEDKGIFDESEDLYRAIACADAYYGDMSSLVELFRAGGKPTIIQNYEENNREIYDDKLLFECAVAYEGGIYVTDMEKNALYYIDEEYNAEYICMIPGCPYGKRRLFSEIKIYKHNLIMIPSSSENLVIYDVNEKRFDIVKLNDEKIMAQYEKFSCGYIRDGYMWMFPGKSKSILKMNMETREIIYIPVCTDVDTYNIKKGILIDGDKVILPSTEGRCFFEYNLITDDIQKKCLNISSTGVWSVDRMGDEYWMMTYPDSHILKYNISTRVLVEVDEYPKEIVMNGYGYAMTKVIDGKYYAFPVKANNIVVVDDKIKVFEIKNFIKKGCIMTYLTTLNDKLLFYRYDKDDVQRLNGKYVCIDIKNNKSSEFVIQINNKDILKRDMNQCRRTAYRTSLMKNLILEEQNTYNKPYKTTCGSEIYQTVGDMIWL